MRGPVKSEATVTGIDSSAAISVDPLQRGDVTLCQVKITNTVVYNIQGRLAPTLPWVDLLDEDKSAGGIFPVVSVPYIRLTNKTGTADPAGISELFLK